MAAAALTDRDIDRALRLIVPAWMLERLDTRLDTVRTVAYVKTSPLWHVGTAIDGLPFPEHAIHVDRTPKGYEVAIVRDRVTLRAGVLPWNRVANWSTVTACRERHESPAIDEQLVLEVQS